MDSAIDLSSSRTCLSEPLRNESQELCFSEDFGKALLIKCTFLYLI